MIHPGDAENGNPGYCNADWNHEESQNRSSLAQTIVLGPIKQYCQIYT
jgi:hypothetical protein